MIIRLLVLVAVVAAAACNGPAPGLGTTAQPLVYASPTGHDFGAIALGSAAPARTFVIGVSGSINEFHTITDISESCSDFSLDLSLVALPAEIYRICEACPTCAQAAICEIQSQRFSVGFTPTVAGPQSCTITVQLDDGVKQVTVMGTGVAPDFALTLLDPTGQALTFGDVVVGDTSSVLPITLRSDGTMPLVISDAALTGGDTAQFVIGNGGPTTVAPGDTHTIDVRCAPTVAGAANATFAITSNDPLRPTVAIALACNGIQSSLSINPSPARFPDTFLDQTSTTRVTLNNTGTAPMTITSMAVSASQFGFTPLADNVIAAGAGVDLDLQFTADAAVVDTDLQGTLSITYDDGEVRSIDLVGPARSATLSVTPGGDVDFGTVCGGQSTRRLFAAINLGSGAFALTAADLTGEGFTFTLLPPLPAPLPARGGATAAFEIMAMPPSGDVTGALTLTPDVAGLAPTTVTLLAHGQADGVAASPASLGFDAVDVQVASGGKSVRLNNCEAVALDVTAATITGRDAADFTAVTDLALPGAIPPYGGTTWLVELTPSSAGEKEAALELTHAGGTTVVPLTGLGLDDGDGDRGSYYACSTGRSGGALTLLLVLALALVPRRRRA